MRIRIVESKFGEESEQWQFDTQKFCWQLLRRTLGAQEVDYVPGKDKDGQRIWIEEYELDDEVFDAVCRSLEHNSRNAGRRRAPIECWNWDLSGISWPEFVERTKDMSQQQIIDEFQLMTPKGGAHDFSGEVRPISRKLLVARLASGAEEYAERQDDRIKFWDYLQ